MTIKLKCHIMVVTLMRGEQVTAGRPTSYKPEYCDKLIQHMSEGLSFESFAGVVDVCKDTLYEWAKTRPEFSDAKKRGLEKARLWWERQGNAGLWDHAEYEDGKLVSKRAINTGVYVFSMKNRFGWKDKVELSGDAEAPVKHEVTGSVKSWTDEQLDDAIRRVTGREA